LEALPSGTVTFLFTDIEGSTKLAQSLGDKWESLRARHHEILESAVESNNGYVFQIIGDAFCASFHTAGEAIRAAANAQTDFHNEDWGNTPVKIRIGINTGTAQANVDTDNSGGYKGYTAMARVQRIMSAGHGGQVLISLATKELVCDDLPENVSLQDAGKCMLKDLIRPEHIYQLVITGLPAAFPPLKTLDAYRHNLPVQLTSFIGREKEIANISATIKDHRLVTLTGVGGTGKTRLSLQVSADLIDEYSDGVWFVQLAPLSDSTLVPQEVASAWQIENQSGIPLSKSLSDYARNKKMLLILDNCEHVLEVCASLVSDLLHAAPNIKILTTSRVSLNVEGEVIYSVHPLALPDPEQNLPLPTLTQYEAVRLFIERAVSVRPSFSVTNDNAPAVAQICQRLDGIPLAIELAAARVRALSPDQIAERLENRFDLLIGGSRNSLPRQQTLRATMDWSYDLLSEDERNLLNQLSVFAGDFSLEAAESICLSMDGSGAGILDLLTALVDNSLVFVNEENSEVRYQLLETVRQYGDEKLTESANIKTLQDRHLKYYVDLAEEGYPHVWVGRTQWIDRFETEYSNFRIAMEHALVANIESAIRLGKPLDMFWDLTHRGKEAHAWALKILELTKTWQPGKLRAMALSLAGTRTAVAIGNYPEALEFIETGLEMIREFGDNNDLMYILQGLAAIHWFARNFEKMHVYSDEYLQIAQELGDQNNIHIALWQLGAAACGVGNVQLGISYYERSLELAEKENSPLSATSALRELALIAFREGDFLRAKELFQKGIQVSKEARWDGNTVGMVVKLAQIALYENNFDQAKRLCKEGLEIWHKSNPTESNVDILAGFSCLAGIGRQYKLAAKLFGATDNAYQEFSEWIMDDVDHMIYDSIVTKVRDEIGADDFNKEWEAGKQMSLDEAIEYAQREVK
jgi:predicted ATPase/class 3 adenylate cyclase